MFFLKKPSLVILTTVSFFWLGEKSIVFVGPFEVLHGYPREVACPVTSRVHASSFSLLFSLSVRDGLIDSGGN